MCDVNRITATHCNTLQHTATHCNTLQHTATFCITCMWFMYMCDVNCITHFIPIYDMHRIIHTHLGMMNVIQKVAVCCSMLQCAAVCCSVLQCDAVCCSVLQCMYHLGMMNVTWSVWLIHVQPIAYGVSFNTLQHTATHCNTLQHTATHCNTLQYVLR